MDFSHSTFSNLMRLPAAERKNAVHGVIRRHTSVERHGGRGDDTPVFRGGVAPSMPAHTADEARSHQFQPGRFPGVYPDAVWGAAPAMPVEQTEDDTVDFIIAMQRPDLTKAQAQACARFLVSMTDDSDLRRFARSPTGLVEAVLYYHDFASNLSVVQRAASLSRCTTLSGSHGEWTRSDDFKVPAQVRIYEQLSARNGIPLYGGGFLCRFWNARQEVQSPLLFNEPVRWGLIPVDSALLYNSTGDFGSGLGIPTVVPFSEAEDFDVYLDSGNSWIVYCPIYGASIFSAITRAASPGLACFYRLSAGNPVTTYHLTVSPAAFMRFANYLKTTPASVAFLNGNNGSWTNTDDVRRGQRRRGNQQQQPRRRARNARNRTARNAPQRTYLGLSNCALKYARAIAAPFAPDAYGACVPMFPSPDSMKTHSHVRSIPVVVGSAGTGGVFISPSGFSDVPVAYATTMQYQDTHLTLPAVEVPGDFAAFKLETLPFAATSELTLRVVSLGLKLSYVGTQLNMSGTVAGFFSPTHATVSKETWTTGSMTVRPYVSFEAVDRRMNFQLQTAAVNAHETAFEYKRHPYSSTVSTGADYDDFRNTAIGAIVVTGVPGSVFNLEIVEHIEYVGEPASSGLTPTHSDARGFEMVQQASAQLASSTANNRESSWSVMQRLLGHAARELAPVAMNGISLVSRGIAARQRRALGFH